jgi:U4/U6.U5 tri-snRNP-associated protein 2
VWTVCLCRGIDFGELLSADVRAKHRHTTYDLMANIVHDGDPGAGKGTYRVHILHKVSQVPVLRVEKCGKV